VPDINEEAKMPVTCKLLFTLAALIVTATISASDLDEEKKEHAALGLALQGVTFSLKDALTASTALGDPVAVRFELDDGTLQVIASVVKGGAWFDVLVDYRSGKVLHADPMTDKDDLAEAKLAQAAMAKATCSLTEAITRAEAANPGYMVVSISPESDGNDAKAEVELLKGVVIKEFQLTLSKLPGEPEVGK
jgi:hypothetical protein